jgi:hypothetical protein
VIDKINAKLQIPAEELCRQGYDGIKLHHVAGKCGVFAETDINGLQKQGVPREELMASLFESIVQQNLAVLTRGRTLRPVVLLLGGPNTFIQGMAEAWRYNIPLVWKERDIPVPDRPLEELIAVRDAQYFAAIGAAGVRPGGRRGRLLHRNGPAQGVHRGRPGPGEGASGLARTLQRAGRAAGIPPPLPARAVGGGAVPSGPARARVHRPRRRLHLDQGGAPRPGKDLAGLPVSKGNRSRHDEIFGGSARG